MKKLILVTAAVLFWAAPAQAKEILGVQLCGASGCQTQHSTAMLSGPGGPFASEAIAPAKPGPWYRGNLLAGDGGKVMGKLPFYYVPGSRTIVQPGRFGQTTVWTAASGSIGVAVQGLATRVKPYGLPRLTNVTVDGKDVTDPQSYLRLWTVGSTPKAGASSGTGSNQIAFFSNPATPWSDGNYMVTYKDSTLLFRDGQMVVLPHSLAQAVAQRASLAPGSGFPWLGVIAAAIAAVVLGSLGAWYVRRLRPVPRAAPQT